MTIDELWKKLQPFLTFIVEIKERLQVLERELQEVKERLQVLEQDRFYVILNIDKLLI